MAKYSEVLLKLGNPIKREKGWMYYITSEKKGDGLITKICRSPMVHKLKEMKSQGLIK